MVLQEDSSHLFCENEFCSQSLNALIMSRLENLSSEYPSLPFTLPFQFQANVFLNILRELQQTPPFAEQVCRVQEICGGGAR